MAADTAYLEGGPCAGTTHKITAAESDTGEIVCKGGLYKNPEKGATHHGDIIFKYAGKAATSTGSSSATLPHGHKGFNAFQRELAHDLPTKLRRSKAIRQHTLRKLGAPRNLGG